MALHVNEVEARLKNTGHRRTRPRQVILRVLQEARTHLNPDEILKKARSLYPAIGRATVYRTLELLTRLGAVRPLFIGDDGPRYTRAEGGHHHLVCTGCGAVIEFESCLGCESQQISRKHQFQVEGHLLEFYGKCRKCGK